LWIADLGKRRLRDWEIRISNLPISQSLFFPLWLIACALPAVWLAANHWTAISQADEDGLLPWGAGVLAMPLENNAAVLADSEKIAPLYYLQQAESVRPDLEIMVLPDEAAYRAELDRRVAAGQTVYLARFLPGLAGSYSLRSAGPLVEVSNRPLETVPSGATTADLRVGPLELLGYTLEPAAAVDSNATAVTLYWRKAAAADPGSAPVIYLRRSGPDFTGEPIAPEGQHPVSNNYPINAWKGNEIIPDYYLLPYPLATCHPLPATCELSIEVAVAPPYTSAADLDWHSITTITLPPTIGPIDGRPYRAQFSSFLLETAAFPTQLRPGNPLEVQYHGYSDGEGLEFTLQPVGRATLVGEYSVVTPEQKSRREIVNCQLTSLNCQLESIRVQTIDTMMENGRYHLIATSENGAAVCGWLRPVTAGCVLGEVEITGVPLPAGAVNFDDQIALLDISLEQETLQPGGQLALELTWQSLAPVNENYTVFVQVLNEQDQIVGQVDAWPVQGTHPTSQWRVGEVVSDPYVVQLRGDLASGAYRLHVGWYLLSTLRRLPVVNEQGAAVDDKVVVDGLRVP
jgi:hypothetical protein